VSHTASNRTAYLRTTHFASGGLLHLYCTSNGVRSANALTIPHVNEPQLTHPVAWRANQTHALTCTGSVAPAVPLTTEFYFDSRLIASITGGFVTAGVSPGLVVNGLTNNAISVKPAPNTNGTFHCLLRFNIAGTTLNYFESTNRWRTNAGASLLAHTLVGVGVALAGLLVRP